MVRELSERQPKNRYPGLGVIALRRANSRACGQGL